MFIFCHFLCDFSAEKFEVNAAFFLGIFILFLREGKGKAGGDPSLKVTDPKGRPGSSHGERRYCIIQVHCDWKKTGGNERSES